MGYKVFLDTDVIIDFLTDRKPHATAFSEIFNLLDKKLIKAYASSLSINNVHYVIKKIIGDTKARAVINELFDLIEMISVDELDLKNAVKSEFKDFEDAIQHSTALKKKDIKSIITRNKRDYRKSKISVLDPNTFLKILQNDQQY